MMGAAMSWFEKRLGRKRPPDKEDSSPTITNPTNTSQERRNLLSIDLESLPDQLHRSKAQSNYPNGTRPYFSERTYALITAEAVRQHWLAQADVSDDLVHFIVNDARRLYTLVLSTFPKDYNSQVEMMKSFHTHGFRDSGLSSQIKLGEKKYPWFKPDQLHKLDMRLWDNNTDGTVCEQQWKVLVPVFSIQQANYDLGGETVLPFFKVKKSVQAKGAFGTVNQVKIEQGHFLGEASTSQVC